METHSLKLFKDYSTNVDQAYIIRIPDNEISERFAARCAMSCHDVGMPCSYWNAYDGHANPIKEPVQMKYSDFMSLLKITDHRLTRTEVACVLSHISLWLKCAKIDRPIVILEHDAVMIKRFTNMNSFNSIVWLGSQEWINQKMQPIPPHGSDGPNYHFMLRAHAYAIDPTMAKNLLAYVLKMGICTSTDCLLRADLFNITHQGFYAYENPFMNEKERETTILNRVGTNEIKHRNDELKL